MTTALRSCVKSVEVKSLANGNMLVELTYRSEPPEKNEYMTPVGVLTRMAIALELQRMIEKRLKC